MKANQSERDMIDAIRLMLGMKMLYADTPEPTALERYTSDSMKYANGSGNRRIPTRNSTTKIVETV